MTFTLDLPVSVTNRTPLFGCVDDMIFKAVEHLNAQVDVEIRGKVGEAGNPFDATGPIAFLVQRLVEVHRPIGMQRTANAMNIQLGDIA